jgi:hypothetical protein
MAIAFTDKGYGMWLAIYAAGHTLACVNGVYTSDNDAAVQAIINAYNPLPDYKNAAITQIEATALQKMQTLFPGLVDVNMVLLIAELWKSMTAAAKAPTPNWSTIISVYTVAQTGVANVNTATSQAAINTVTSAIVWPI